MKFRKLFYALLTVVLFIGFTSCDNDEKIFVDNQSVSIVIGNDATVIILSGNADYTAVSDNQEIATATIDGNTVRIFALKLGAANITVRDKANESIVIAVNVTRGYALFEVDRYGIDVKAEDKEIKEIIETELMDAATFPIAIGSFYGLKTITNELYVFENGLEGEVITGTFFSSSGVMTMTYSGKEFVYQFQSGAAFKSVGGSVPVTALTFIEVLTEFYQEKYTDAGITQVLRGHVVMYR